MPTNRYIAIDAVTVANAMFAGMVETISKYTQDKRYVLLFVFFFVVVRLVFFGGVPASVHHSVCFFDVCACGFANIYTIYYAYFIFGTKQKLKKREREREEGLLHPNLLMTSIIVLLSTRLSFLFLLRNSK